MLYYRGMIIENKELKELLEQEALLLEAIKDDKARVAELTDEMREIQKRNETELNKIAELRQKYTKIAVPIILKSLKDNEMFADIELVDGEVSYQVIDVLEGLEERAIEETKKQKDDWVAYVTPKEDTK